MNSLTRHVSNQIAAHKAVFLFNEAELQIDSSADGWVVGWVGIIYIK